MEVYGFVFKTPELIALGILLLALLYELSYYFGYLNVVGKMKRLAKNGRINYSDKRLAVSVIIAARDESDNLRKFLPFVLEQEYPEFEVIVVNDGSTDETEDLLTEFKKKYPHLRSSFVPTGTTNLSTKKLALTIAIKAAKHDILLFTDADCMPESKNWIAKMMRNFVPGVDFVLGYSPYLQKKSWINRVVIYDTLFNGLTYLGFALKGKPYMGVGRNLAYRKEIFYNNKGFASHLHLKSGDDDLMVNANARDINTRIELDADSITWSEPKLSFKQWYYQKERHLSVASHYSSTSKFRLGIEPIFRGVFYAVFIATLLLGNYISMGAAGLLFLVRYIVQLVIINKAAKHFSERKFYLTLPLFDIYLPLLTAYIMTFGRMGKKSKNIIWK